MAGGGFESRRTIPHCLGASLDVGGNAKGNVREGVRSSEAVVVKLFCFRGNSIVHPTYKVPIYRGIVIGYRE